MTTVRSLEEPRKSWLARLARVLALGEARTGRRLVSAVSR